MWELICELLPVLAFLTGTLLGGLIMTLFHREQRRNLETQFKNSSNTNVALESQLVSKSQLENDLARTNTELEKLRREIQEIKVPTTDLIDQFRQENDKLRKELKKLKSSELAPKKDYVNDYQLFLLDLEKSIKKAKKNSFEKPTTTPKSKKKDKKKSTDKYDFYKQKYAGKSLNKPLFNPADLEESRDKPEVRDLTYLHGITKEVQKVLKKHQIKTFSDLSSMKIAELRAILSLEGDQFENVDPLNWPIQARIAEKGQWNILDEYKAKMKL